LKPPAAWEAYEYYLRGAEGVFLHMSRRTKSSLYEARRLLGQSLAIDPDYARAAAVLSRTHNLAYVEPLDGDHPSPAALDRAVELAETAVRLDARLPQPRAQFGYVLLFKRRHDAGIAEFERAFALNANFIDYRFAQVLTFAGQQSARKSNRGTEGKYSPRSLSVEPACCYGLEEPGQLRAQVLWGDGASEPPGTALSADTAIRCARQRFCRRRSRVSSGGD
jgi:tetratricopeptide (TPR) repeat protein